ELNPFGFSTKYRDEETELYYYGYKYYTPSMGWFLNRDPIEEQGGLNLYGFVTNDPVSAWDYLGLDIQWNVGFGGYNSQEKVVGQQIEFLYLDEDKDCPCGEIIFRQRVKRTAHDGSNLGLAA